MLNQRQRTISPRKRTVYSERKTGMALPLTMPVMTLVLFAPVLPFRFPPLNLSVRDRNHALCQPFETLEWISDGGNLERSTLRIYHFIVWSAKRTQAMCQRRQ
jgi:hypothetical protein